MDLAVKKKLRDAFLHYEENKKLAEEQTSAINMGLVALYGSVKVQGGNNNGRENAIIKAIDKECELNRWVYMVDKVIDYFYIIGKDNYIFYRYFKGYPKERVCFLCHISERAYYYWDNEVLMVALKWAKIYKLI